MPAKDSRWPPHPLTREEARRLIEVADDGTSTGIRNKAICAVLYRTGARCNEMCELQIGDVYPLDDGCMIIRIGKPKGYGNGAMPREIGMDKRAGGYLFDYMRLRGPSDGPLFLTRNGAPVLPSYIRQMLPRLAKLGSVNRRVHPHCFRHTFARELYGEGVGLMEIMLALGHTSLTTTQQYLRSIGATEVVNTTTNREW
jgi:site-specific recombinase XerD